MVSGEMLNGPSVIDGMQSGTSMLAVRRSRSP